MAKYRCNSPDCANQPVFEGPKGLQRCLNCGAADPVPVRSFVKPTVYGLLFTGLAALAWYYFPEGLTSKEAATPEETNDPEPVAVCKLVGFANTSTDNCLVQLKPRYGGECSGSESILHREVGGNEWSILNAGTSFSMVGKDSLHLEFKFGQDNVVDTIISGNCSKLSPSDLNDRKGEIVAAIKDFINNPISSARYNAHEKTKLVPNGKVILPDGSVSSGLRWQTDVFMLWPNEPLNVDVTLDEFGTIQLIKLT